MPFSHRRGSLAALGLILITIVPVTAEGPPLPLQILGRLFVVPSGQPGRHSVLVVLRLSETQHIYMQVDELRSGGTSESRSSLFRALRGPKSIVDVRNGAILSPLLTSQNIEEAVSLSGFFYRTSGHLVIVSAVLAAENVDSATEPPKVHTW